MSLVFLLDFLLSLGRLFAVKRRGLCAVKKHGLVVLLLIAQPNYAQDSSVANTVTTPVAAEQQTEVTEPGSAAPLYQNSLTPKNTQAPQTNGNTTAQIGSGRHLVNVTLALMGIIGLIFAISWFVKRFSQGAFSANAHIKILLAMPLGTRERIVLIEVGGQQLLLGITSTNINTLHMFETPIVVENKTDNQSDFSRKLMAILQQKSPITSMQDSNNKNDSAL